MLDMLFFYIELHLLRVQRWGVGRIKTFLLSWHHGSGLAVSCSLSVSEYRVDQSYPNNRIRVAFCVTRAAFSANHDTKPLLSRRWRKSPVALCSGHKLCVLVITLYWETLLFVPTSNDSSSAPVTKTCFKIYQRLTHRVDKIARNAQELRI